MCSVSVIDFGFGKTEILGSNAPARAAVLANSEAFCFPSRFNKRPESNRKVGDARKSNDPIRLDFMYSLRSEQQASLFVFGFYNIPLSQSLKF